MVLSWHVVALIPVGFPAATDREACSVVERHFAIVYIPEGIGRRDIADVIVEVHALNVDRILSRDLFETVVALAIVVVVDTAKFAFKFSTDVL